MQILFIMTLTHNKIMHLLHAIVMLTIFLQATTDPLLPPPPKKKERKKRKKEISLFLIFHRFSPFYCLNNSKTVKNSKK